MSGAQLRLWQPEGEPAGPRTLCEFYRDWYVEIRLGKVTRSTRLVYEDAMRWYSTLTGDPTWEVIDERFLARYDKQLQQAEYRRGSLGYLRKLAAGTYNKLLNHLLAVVKAAIRKGFLQEDLYWMLPTSDYRPEPGDRFSVDELRAMYAAADQVNGPHGNLPVPTFWRLFLSMAFYVGERRGTLLALRRHHLQERRDGLWWNIPSEIVSKTGKADAKPVHPFLLPLLKQAPNLLHGYRGDQIGRQFRRLQNIAGVKQKKLHAIRASHSQTLGELGLEIAEGLAQSTLQHSSVKITREHYVELRNGLLRKFPDLN